MTASRRILAAAVAMTFQISCGQTPASSGIAGNLAAAAASVTIVNQTSRTLTLTFNKTFTRPRFGVVVDSETCGARATCTYTTTASQNISTVLGFDLLKLNGPAGETFAKVWRADLPNQNLIRLILTDGAAEGAIIVMDGTTLVPSDPRSTGSAASGKPPFPPALNSVTIINETNLRFFLKFITAGSPLPPGTSAIFSPGPGGAAPEGAPCGVGPGTSDAPSRCRLASGEAGVGGSILDFTLIEFRGTTPSGFTQPSFYVSRSTAPTTPDINITITQSPTGVVSAAITDVVPTPTPTPTPTPAPEIPKAPGGPTS